MTMQDMQAEIPICYFTIIFMDYQIYHTLQRLNVPQ
jgi:hypothetical protein